MTREEMEEYLVYFLSVGAVIALAVCAGDEEVEEGLEEENPVLAGAYCTGIAIRTLVTLPFRLFR